MRHKQILIEKYIIPERSAQTIFGVENFFEHCYNKYGELHSTFDNPSEVIFFKYKNSSEFILHKQIWHKNGEIHRDGDKPAVIIYKHGIHLEKQWFKNGKIHRENNNPAHILYNRKGLIIGCWNYLDGNLVLSLNELLKKWS
jgi:hypothetical protein